MKKQDKPIKVIGALARDLALRAEGQKRNEGRESALYVDAEGNLVPVPEAVDAVEEKEQE